MENLTKPLWREILKKVRKHLSEARKEEAREHLLTWMSYLDFFSHVLSFSSFGEEIDLTLINDILCEQGKLYLPKVENGKLCIFHVTDLTHLTRNTIGILEPDRGCCKPFDAHKLSIALVPGLGFDSNHNRLGYGRGYYDRFLKSLPFVNSIGIGYKEQWVPQLPVETHDIAVSSVCFF